MPRRHWPRTQDAYRSYTGGHTRLRPDGYIEEYCPTHPGASKTGMVLQHRLVMERRLGRYLSGQETVHHLNEVKADNRDENLGLFATRADHIRHHKRETSIRYNPESIELVRKAAADPKVRVDHLPMSPNVVRGICRDHGLEWKSDQTEIPLTDLQVREALQGRSIRDAAKLLGCSYGTLQYRFGHLLGRHRRPSRWASKSGVARGESGTVR